MKMKKFLPAFVASVFMTSSVFTTTAFAIIAEASTPRIYVDIVYESDTQIRADVIFENMPETYSGGFHLNVADGWKINDINDEGYFKIEKLNYTGQDLGIGGKISTKGTNNTFIYYYGEKNVNANGHFCSFYISKTDTYSETNSDISVYFEDNYPVYDYIGSQLPSGEYVEYFRPNSNEEIELPKIEKVNEYIIGDANGDVYVNSKDASAILSAISNNGGNSFSVPLIESHFTRFFPYAKAPAAPDANNDGYISREDAELALNYYSSVSTGEDYVGAIGSKAVYEYYSN